MHVIKCKEILVFDQFSSDLKLQIKTDNHLPNAKTPKHPPNPVSMPAMVPTTRSNMALAEESRNASNPKHSPYACTSSMVAETTARPISRS